MTMNEHEFSHDQATKLREHARDTVKVQRETSLGVAKALYTVKFGTLRGSTIPLYEAWGFESFEEYCEDELKTHGGTGKSYVRVYDELCVRRNIPEDDLPLSITALRELARVSRRKTAAESGAWLKKSRELCACDLH